MTPIKRIGSDSLREQQMREAIEYNRQQNKKLTEFVDSQRDKTPERIQLEKENPGKKLVGFWAGSSTENMSGLPYPKSDTFCGSKEELEKIATYLDSGEKIAQYLGSSGCRICGERLGSADCSDGVYVWPEKLSHYLIQHRVKLPDDFIKYVLEEQLGKKEKG